MVAIKRLIYICLFLLAAASVAVFWDLYHYAASPAAVSAEKRIVTVPPGIGINALSYRLHQAKIITSPEKFKYIALVKSRDKKIKAGEYKVSAAMSPAAIIDMMIRGDVVMHRLTVPEGYTIRQIAALVADAGLADKGVFIRTAMDPDVTQKMGITADTLEGYLFPETYFFPASAGTRDIVSAMVNRFKTVFTNQWERRASELGFTVHEIVTLASIIEKESVVDNERPLIASVFHNRLARNMRIESDPTVIYGIKNFNGNITKAHLNTSTPYNTYRIKGLPQGPIANPGKNAIEAALYPADTPYLYFVAKNDGTHKFSVTLQSHNQAVRKYQLNR